MLNILDFGDEEFYFILEKYENILKLVGVNVDKVDMEWIMLKNVIYGRYNICCKKKLFVIQYQLNKFEVFNI